MLEANNEEGPSLAMAFNLVLWNRAVPLKEAKRWRQHFEQAPFSRLHTLRRPLVPLHLVRRHDDKALYRFGVFDLAAFEPR